jgi:hypothetical protein
VQLGKLSCVPVVEGVDLFEARAGVLAVSELLECVGDEELDRGEALEANSQQLGDGAAPRSCAERRGASAIRR